jgi:hypothetical protein
MEAGMTNVQERGPSGTIAITAATQQPATQAAIGTSTGAMLQPSDTIRRLFQQPQQQQSSLYTTGPLQPGGGNSIIQQLLNIIQQLLSALGLGGLGGGLGSIFGNGNSWNAPQGNEQYFQSATGSSVGDPHLSFNGTTGAGGNDTTKFDSMSGHSDLLDSDSFAGGYQISTGVTQPGANGVTYNQQATIATNFGNTQVCLDKNGNATIVQNGQTITLANGQSYDLGNGETVKRNADGSVVVNDSNGMGGNITTTLSVNGQGVNVNTQASNVDLGGDLLNPPGQLVPLASGPAQPQQYMPPNLPHHHHHHHPIGEGNGVVQPINYQFE